ncbi:unnamed protein product [Ascophyllum nodosum]
MKHAAVTSHGLKEPDLRNLSDQKRVKMLLGSFKDSKRSVSGKPTMIKTHHSSSGNQPKHWRTGRLRGTTRTRRDLAMMNEALDVRDSEEIRKKDPVNLLALQREKTNNIFLQKKIFEQEVKNREILRRASHHIIIDRLVNVLSEDICSLSRNSKGHLGVLEDLRKRVTKLRSMNTNGSSKPPWADRQVEVDLKVNLSRDGTLMFKSCSKCKDNVLKDVLTTHERFCQGLTLSERENSDDGKDADDGDEVDERGKNDRGPESANNAMLRCPHCGRLFRTERIAKHVHKCSKEAEEIGNRGCKGGKGLSTVPKMAPRPPLNVRVVESTCDKVTLAWDPPIFDGGVAIFEHEVSYSAHEVARKDKYSKEDVATPAEPVFTSRWCMSKPISTNGFTLTGLAASTHLVNITVRCRNAVGWSDSSEVLPEVYTKEAMPPGEPLFFRVDTVRSNRAVLSWKEPLFNGGKEVVEYELSYSNVLPEVHQVLTSNKVDAENSHHKCLRPPASVDQDQTLLLRGLRASTLYKDITLRAIGASGLASLPVRVPDFTTLSPGRRQRICDELSRARAATGVRIDTDFYKGILQRENREDFIAKLEKDLANLPHEDESDRDSHESGAGLQVLPRDGVVTCAHFSTFIVQQEFRSQEEELFEAVLKGYKKKKIQFEYRLKRLREQVDECEENRLEHINQRAVLSQRLITTQARVTEVQAELYRIASFKGSCINSSVVDGSQQQFPIEVLRQKLRQEFEKGQASIAHDKADLVKGANNSSRAIQLKLKKEEDLKERIAAFATFNRNAARARKLAVNVIRQNDSILKGKVFSALALTVQSLRREKATVLNALVRIRLRFLHAAFMKWKAGEHMTASYGNASVADYVIRGVGGRLLLHAEDERRQLEEELQVVMKSAASLRRSFGRISVTNEQRRELEASTVFHETDMGNFMDDCEAAGLATALLAQGDGFLKLGQPTSAAACYSQQIEMLRLRSDRRGLCLLGVVQARLAKAQRACDNLSFAALSFERALEVSNAADHLPGIVDALEGLGMCSLDSRQHREAVVFFKDALARNVEVKDRSRDARLYRALEKGYRRLVDEERAELYAAKAEAIEKEIETKLSRVKAALDDATARLVGRAAVNNSAKVVRFHRVTACYVTMRAKRASLGTLLEETLGAKENQEKVVKKHMVKLELIRGQLQEALETDKDEMSSTLVVEGEVITFEIEELKIRLRGREVEVAEELKESADLLTSLTNRVNNTTDELETLGQDIEIEGGGLMTSVVEKARFRLIALNPVNIAGNEVEGTAIGGVEKVVAAEGKKVLVYRLVTGDLEHVFSGDEAGRHTGELLGHSGLITALFFYKNIVYTGSMDYTVQVWSIEERKRLHVLRGHEATVCSVVADEDKIVSGGADRKIMIWNPTDGGLLKALQGHTRSVVSLHSGPSFILSGGADGEVCVWGPMEVSSFGRAEGDRHLDRDEEVVGRYKCKQRLTGHHRSAVCVSSGRLEVVTGHEDGEPQHFFINVLASCPLARASAPTPRKWRAASFEGTHELGCLRIERFREADIASTTTGTVIVWWTATGMITMKSKVHSGPVRQLQFDATKVVSCSADGVIAVTDLTTGDRTRTLRGHEGAVLAVAFDRSKIISASDDGTLRTWVWASRSAKQDKYAVLGPGDNLGRLAKQYNVTVADIVRWNGVRDPRHLRVGSQLIVQKGNPNEPTRAEVKASKMMDINARKIQTIERARVRSKEAVLEEGGIERQRWPNYLTESLKDNSRLIGRIARRDLPFTEMWQEAKRLEIVESSAYAYGDTTVAGRTRKRMRAIEKETAVFDSNSDTSGTDDVKGSDESDGPQEDVLAKQTRDRERFAVDVSHVLTGVVVAQLARGAASDAVACSAPPEGILGRIMKALDKQAAVEGESPQPGGDGAQSKNCLPRMHRPRAPESTTHSGDTAAPALTTPACTTSR